MADDVTLLGVSIEFDEEIYYPPPTLSEYSIQKSMSYGGKYTFEKVAEHLKFTIGCDGPLTGLLIESSSPTQVTLGIGEYSHNGMTAEYDASETITDPETFSDPYYLCGRIYKSGASYLSELTITDDPSEKAIIATKDGTWQSAPSINLDEIWQAALDHIEDFYHPTQAINDGLSSATPPNSTDHYVCRLSANEFTDHNAHYMASLLAVAIESVDSNPNSIPVNMYADNIHNGPHVTPSGINGSLINHLESKSFGPLGMYAPREDYSIEIGPIAIVEASAITDHIMIATAYSSIITGATPTFDISTNLSTYEVLDTDPGTYIPISSLSPAPDGKYHIKLRLNLPLINTGSSWSSEATLAHAVSNHTVNFLDNRIHIIGGLSAPATAADSIAYSSIQQSSVTTGLDTDRHSTFSGTSLELGRIFIMNGYDASGSFQPNLLMIIPADATIKTLMALTDTAGTSGVLQNNTALHGTGVDAVGETDKWNITNIPTESTQALQNFPESVTGMLSSKSTHFGNSTIHTGGYNGTSLLSSSRIFSMASRSFISIAEAPAPIMSHSESADVSMSNTVFHHGTPDTPSAVAFTDTTFEYNAATDSYISQPVSPAPAGNGGLTLCSDGNMRVTGGSDAGSTQLDTVTTLSKPGLVISGWGIEWQ